MFDNIRAVTEDDARMFDLIVVDKTPASARCRVVRDVEMPTRSTDDTARMPGGFDIRLSSSGGVAARLARRASERQRHPELRPHPGHSGRRNSLLQGPPDRQTARENKEPLLAYSSSNPIALMQDGFSSLSPSHLHVPELAREHGHHRHGLLHERRRRLAQPEQPDAWPSTRRHRDLSSIHKSHGRSRRSRDDALGHLLDCERCKHGRLERLGTQATTARSHRRHETQPQSKPRRAAVSPLRRPEERSRASPTTSTAPTARSGRGQTADRGRSSTALRQSSPRTRSSPARPAATSSPTSRTRTRPTR